ERPVGRDLELDRLLTGRRVHVPPVRDDLGALRAPVLGAMALGVGRLDLDVVERRTDEPELKVPVDARGIGDPERGADSVASAQLDRVGAHVEPAGDAWMDESSPEPYRQEHEQ